MNIRLLSFLFVLTNIHYVFSQELPQIMSHSPDVANLGKYGEYPIDISTGVPQIEIPLYTIKSGELQLPISISYHASGIRVDQESSSVGLGWSLNAGGFISRVVRDGVDDDYTGFLYKGNNLPHYNGVDNEGLNGAGNTGNDNVLRSYFFSDSEPDIFSLNANGLSGQFCLDNTLKFVGMGYEPYKYEVDLQNKTIVITNEKGDIYRFGKSLKNEEAFETTYDTDSSADSTLPPETTPNKQLWYNSSYHLTEIISYNRQDTISFQYKNARYGNTRLTSSTRYILYEFWPFGIIDNIGRYFKGLISSFTSTSIDNVRILDKIVFKNGTIEFNVVRDRLDVPNGMDQQYWMPRVGGFAVFDKKRKKIADIVFDNDHYFNRVVPSGSNIREFEKKSLKLNAIKFNTQSNTLENEYVFEYDSTALPPKNTTSQDFWGYYNGKGNSTLIPETFYQDSFTGAPIYIGSNRDADINYMKAGVLKKIIYPTKGYTTYDFEPHYYLTTQQAENKVLTNKTVALYAINRLPSCPTGYFEGIPANNTLEFQVTEELSNNGVDTGRLTVMFSDYIMLNGAQSMTFELTDLDNTGYGGVYYFSHSPSDKDNRKVFTQDVSIKQGHRYRLEAKTNGVTGSYLSLCDSPHIEVKLSYNYWKPETPLQVIPKQAGGLRVKTITNFDFNNMALNRKKYEYGDGYYGPNNLGIGTLISEKSNNFYFKPRLYAINEGFQELKNVLWFTSSSQSGLGLNNGSPVDYDKVTEYSVSLSDNTVTNGKVEYYYSKTGRDREPKGSIYYPYDSFKYPSWKKSNLLSKKYYKQKPDQSYELLRSEEYDYSDMPEKRIKTLKIFEVEPDVYFARQQIDLGNWLYLDDNPKRFYRYNFYESIGKRVLNRKITKEYLNGIEIMSSSMDYTYGNPNHMQLTALKSTNSDGAVLRSQMVYPQDLVNPSTSELDLIGKNRLAVPIKTENFKKQGTQAEQKLSSEYTVYNHLKWPDQNLPELLKTSKGTDSLRNSIIYHDYYSNGNIKELSKADGMHIVYIWGYRKEYPIAKIEHATFTAGQPTSITLAQQNLINAAVSAADGDVSPGTEDTLRIRLRELREGFPDAMVTTYTYDPLIGMTSMTDAKGQTVYYDYDVFNRLERVRDASGNILSRNEYHYKDSY